MMGNLGKRPRWGTHHAKSVIVALKVSADPRRKKLGRDGLAFQDG